MTQADTEFLGLVTGDEPGHYSFTVEKHLARLDYKLYGGTAIAASIAASEALTDRQALWMTTQYVATAPADAKISVLAEVLADGRRTNQVRVTGTDESGEVMFASLGATGRPHPDGLTGQFVRRPMVVPVGEAEPWTSLFTGLKQFADPGFELPPFPEDVGFNTVMELRHAAILDKRDPGPGRICLWVRRTDRQPITATVAAFMADMVPLAVAHALELIAAGTSLDNTIRFGSFEESEWILIDLVPHLAAGGYAYGMAHIWNEEGRLMATASQTASMIRFEFVTPEDQERAAQGFR